LPDAARFGNDIARMDAQARRSNAILKRLCDVFLDEALFRVLGRRSEFDITII